jgi:ankyrin repeat protein
MDSGGPNISSAATPAEDEADAAARLRRAVIEGDESLVRELLGQNRGNAAQSSDAGGRTLLDFAVEHGQLSLIPILLEHGVDIEALDASGRTALHRAVGSNDLTLSKLLLNCGANIEATTSDGEKPLWQAANGGTEAVARLLLERGADVESFNPKSGTTALFEAVNQGHVGLIKLLLEAGADIDARPLISENATARPGEDATRRTRRGSVVYSEASGYQRHHREHKHKFRRSALKMEEEKRTTGPVYRKATTRHSHVHAYPAPAPDLPPEESASKTDEEVRPPPRRNDVPASQSHPGRELPLHQAVANGDAEVVKLLLQHGADPAIRGKDGRTAQQVADEQHLEGLATLLRTGPVLEGPAITSNKGKPREVPPVTPIPHAPPRSNPAKIAACQAFEATIIEFYTEEREQRYQQSATMYDLLYGKGPEEILRERRDQSLQARQANFTWYHLPANNVSVLADFVNLERVLTLPLQMEWTEVSPGSQARDQPGWFFLDC